MTDGAQAESSELNRRDVPALWRRVLVLIVAATAIQLLLRALHVAAPSERWHAMLPLLWLIERWLSRKSPFGTRNGPTFIGFGGLALGLLLVFWNVAALLARTLDGHFSWGEPLLKVWMTASLAVFYMALAAVLTFMVKRLPRAKILLATRRGWWLRAVIIGVALALFVPDVFATFSAHRFKIANNSNPRAAHGLAYEEVNFPSAGDDVRLRGWLIPCRGSDAAVVVCHGIGANKGAFLGVAPFLHRAGFNVLMFDFRGHGDSAGHTTSFGFHEGRDVQGAVRFLRGRRFKRLAAYAFSMGGSALLHAIDDLPDVRGVVLDSTFAELAPIVRHQLSFVPRGLDRWMLAGTDFYGKLETGVSIFDIVPRRHIARLSPRPVLIIHGTADRLIPTWQARSNFAAARGPKELWLVSGAEHCRCRLVAPAIYEKRVALFLRRCLDGPSAPLTEHLAHRP